MHFGAHAIHDNEDLISSFIKKVEVVVQELENRQLLIPGKLGVLGLSRGAFIAAHAAAKIPNINPILGFAPLTKLTYVLVNFIIFIIVS